MLLSIVVALEAALAGITALLTLCWVLGFSSYFFGDDRSKPKLTEGKPEHPTSFGASPFSSKRTEALGGVEDSAATRESIATTVKESEPAGVATKKEEAQGNSSASRKSDSVHSRSSSTTSHNQSLSTSKFQRTEAVVSSGGDYDPWGTGGLTSGEPYRAEGDGTTTGLVDGYSIMKAKGNKIPMTEVEEDEIALGGDATNFIHAFRDATSKSLGIPMRNFYHNISGRFAKSFLKKSKKPGAGHRNWSGNLKSLVTVETTDFPPKMFPSKEKALHRPLAMQTTASPSTGPLFRGMISRSPLQVALPREPKIQSSLQPSVHVTHSSTVSKPQQRRFLKRLFKNKVTDTPKPQGTPTHLQVSSQTFSLDSKVSPNIPPKRKPISLVNILPKRKPISPVNITLQRKPVSPVNIPPKRKPISLANILPSIKVFPPKTEIRTERAATSLKISTTGTVAGTHVARRRSPISKIKVPSFFSKISSPEPLVLSTSSPTLQYSMSPSVEPQKLPVEQVTRIGSPSTITVTEYISQPSKIRTSPANQCSTSSDILHRNFSPQPAIKKSYISTPTPVSTHGPPPKPPPPKRPISPMHQKFTTPSLTVNQRSLLQPDTKSVPFIKSTFTKTTLSLTPSSKQSTSSICRPYLQGSNLVKETPVGPPSKPPPPKLMQQRYQSPTTYSEIIITETPPTPVTTPHSVPTTLFTSYTQELSQKRITLQPGSTYKTSISRRSLSPVRIFSSSQIPQSLQQDSDRLSQSYYKETPVRRSASPSRWEVSKNQYFNRMANYRKAVKTDTNSEFESNIYPKDFNAISQAVNPMSVDSLAMGVYQHVTANQQMQDSSAVFDHSLQNHETQELFFDTKMSNFQTNTQNENIVHPTTYNHLYDQQQAENQESGFHAVKNGATQALHVVNAHELTDIRPSFQSEEVTACKKQKPKPPRPPRPSTPLDRTTRMALANLQTKYSTMDNKEPMPYQRIQREERKRPHSVALPMSRSRRILPSTHRFSSLSRSVTKLETPRQQYIQKSAVLEYRTMGGSQSVIYVDGDISKDKDKEVEMTLLAAVSRQDGEKKDALQHKANGNQNVPTTFPEYQSKSKPPRPPPVYHSKCKPPRPSPPKYQSKAMQDIQRCNLLPPEERDKDNKFISEEQPTPPARSKQNLSQDNPEICEKVDKERQFPSTKHPLYDQVYEMTEATKLEIPQNNIYQNLFPHKPQTNHFSPPLPPKLYPKISLSDKHNHIPPKLSEKTSSSKTVKDKDTTSDILKVHESKLTSSTRLKDLYPHDQKKITTKNKYILSGNKSDMISNDDSVQLESKERRHYENVIFHDATSSPNRIYRERWSKSPSPKDNVRASGKLQVKKEELCWSENSDFSGGNADVDSSVSCSEYEALRKFRWYNVDSTSGKGTQGDTNISKSRHPRLKSETVKRHQRANRQQNLQRGPLDSSESISDEEFVNEVSGKTQGKSTELVEQLRKKLSNLSESEDRENHLDLKTNVPKDKETPKERRTQPQEIMSSSVRHEGMADFSSSVSLFSSHSSAFFDSSSEDSEYDVESEDVSEDDRANAKRERKLYRIAEELVTTEERFVAALRLLNEDFRKFVNQANKLSDEPVVPEENLNQILRHLPELQKLNESLLKELQTRLEEWAEQRKIADLIKSHVPVLKLYSSYMSDYKSMVDILEESKKKYPVFQHLVRDFEALPRCKGLSLNHYMLRPIQRIPQYRLFLERYLKYLPPETAEYQDTSKALEIITQVNEQSNECLRRGDNFSKLLSIQNTIFGNFEIVKPGRVFLKEGELMKLSRKEMQPRWFILFNDYLLCTTPVQKNLLIVHHELPLTGMKVSIPQQQEYQNEFSIISVQRSYTVAARIPEIRDDWISALCEAIEENISRQRSLHMIEDDSSAEEDQSDEEIGRKAPVWIPDVSVTMCQLCTRDFTMTYHRHHCRGCGKVICSACSANRAPLYYLHDRMARVCDRCLLALQQVG